MVYLHVLPMGNLCLVQSSELLSSVPQKSICPGSTQRPILSQFTLLILNYEQSLHGGYTQSGSLGLRSNAAGVVSICISPSNNVDNRSSLACLVSALF